MPVAPKTVTRQTLARYAGLLGRNSLARQTLDAYDARKAQGEKGLKIIMRNNDFRLRDAQGTTSYT